MWKLTGFADEIGPDLNEQLDTLQSEGLKYLELRGVWGKGVLTLSDEEVARVGEELKRRGMGVSSIGSPIGKIQITDPFEPHLELFRRALWCAEQLEAPYIRLFSFRVPEGEAEKYRDEVMQRMKALVDEASGRNVTLVHENEKHIYGDIPERCLDLLTTIDQPHFRMAWDPANFVQCGVRPYQEGYEKLRPYIEYVHVKDAHLETGKVTLAGEGDGDLRQTIRSLRDSGFEGFFSLEPHIQRADRFAHLTNAQKFTTAIQAFKRLLQDEGIGWS